jgi:bifunctional DNase/RNase
VLFATVALAACMRPRSHDRRSDVTPPGSSSASADAVRLPVGPGASTSAALEPGPRPSAGLPTPEHYVEVSVGAVGPTPRGHVVLLLDPSKHRAVPIFIGESEAFSIKLRLAHRSYPRPLSHDLLETILHKLGGRVEQVRVERLVENAYVATVVVVRDQERFELDARSSDAIALALGSQVPIFMAEDVLRSTAVELDRLPPITPPEREDGSPPSEQTGVAM